MKKIIVLFIICFLSAQLKSQIVTVPYHEDFESPEGADSWSTYDLNSDDGNWFYADQATYGGMGYQQSSCFAYVYSYQNPGDDWLVSPGLQFNTGTHYNISFKYAAFDNTKTEKLSVYIGTDSQPAGFTNLLVTFDSLTSTAWQTYSCSYTPLVSDTFYIGYYAFSDVDQGAILIDEFEVSVPASEVNEPTLLAEVSVFPNPSFDYITLENASDCSATLLDVSGKTVGTYRIDNENSRIDLGEFNKGIYFFKVEKMGVTKTFKILISE